MAAKFIAKSMKANQEMLKEITDNVLPRSEMRATLLEDTLIRLFCCLILLHWFVSSVFAAPHKSGSPERNTRKRSVAVADVIEMNRLAGYASTRSVALFSPDGSKLVVVLRKGNLKTNTNEYSLLLWRTDEVFQPSAPQVLLSMSSSSSRGTMNDLRWLQDGETISFLGEHRDELQQLYTFNVRTRTLKKITSHPSNLVSYSMTGDGKRIAYIAETPVETLFDKSAAREGVVVSTQFLGNLLAGRKGGSQWEGGEDKVFFQAAPSPIRPIRMAGKFLPESLGLSPDGNHIVIRTCTAEIPDLWQQYRDPVLHTLMGKTFIAGQCYWVTRYVVVDTATGDSHVLLNAPVGSHGSQIVWSPDSRSIFISDIFLPLEIEDVKVRKARQSSTYTVELEIPTGRILSTVTEEQLLLLGSDPNGSCLRFQSGAKNQRDGSPVLLCKDGEKWQKAGTDRLQDTRPGIHLEEGLNSPPKLVAVDPSTNRRAILFDLNPQFRALHFARVEEVRWKKSDGPEVKGGLYYPVGYEAGKKYPLVIQTHGFNPDQFWIDGPYSTAFAAQPLAGKGIMVLQADEGWDMDDSPGEGDREVFNLENAIGYLNSMALIDSSRVGIIGFSRTCLFVKYALTHPAYHFAAASVTDGVDGVYFKYLVYANMYPDGTQFAESVNGAAPFGQGLKAWLKRSPGFNMDKVNTPLLIVAPNKFALLGDWEWFIGLSRLHKPVEVTYMENGAHLLQRPWQRRISLQENVDWFAFWLKGEEDPNPAKAEQYNRWRELRTLKIP